MTHHKETDPTPITDPTSNQSPSLSNAAPEESVSGEENAKPGWRALFRAALDKTRRTQPPVANRKELSKDRSKAMFVLAGAALVLVFVFFSVFSSPKKQAQLPGENRNAPALGRKVTPGQEEQEAAKTVVPMLNAEVKSDAPTDREITADDVGRTARMTAQPMVTASTPMPTRASREDNALRNVNFAGAGPGNPATPQPAQPAQGDTATDLKKPSIVYVKSTNVRPSVQPRVEDSPSILAGLSAGTRLVARLQTPVSSAVQTPIVAVVEYNYERDGDVLLPAGTRVFGRLTDVNNAGLVGMRFDRLEMPDGTTDKVDASAMSLTFGPIKGQVSGRKRGTRFLVQAGTGLGTIATYLVGSHGSNGIDGPISESALLRERIADNVGQAGQQELNNLTMNQNIVVTVPGNTRFYIVLQKGGQDERGGIRNTASSVTKTANNRVPTVEELRELMQLRNELDQMYQQQTSPGTTGLQAQTTSEVR